MAIACDLTTLRTASKCYDCLSSTEKFALKVNFMTQALRAKGGADLTNINTLLKSVACLACEPDFALESMELAVWKDIATTDGASIPATVSAQRALIKCTPCGEQKTRRAAYLSLLCQLHAEGAI